MLAAGPDRDALAAFYYRRLGHMKVDEGRRGERLRLWDALAELCLQLGRREDAVTAFEVALTLAPDDLPRRQRLADFYLDADPKHYPDAIVQHQLVLRSNKRRMASYEALRLLYKRTNELEKARACDDALSIIGMHVVDEKIEALFGRAITNVQPGASRTLSNEDWLALSRFDIDQQLTALFAIVAPAFAAERARLRPPPAMPALQEVPTPIANAILQVASVFGIAAPPVLLDRDQVNPCGLAMRTRDGALVPVLVMGRTALDSLIDDKELAFTLARQLADLRSDRIARLFCPKSGDLTQIIEIAMAPNNESPTARALAASLPAHELDQMRSIGARLRERGIDPARAALEWLAATERAADRIGFVVIGDIATCVRVLERDQSEENRILELVWSSITEEVLAARGRVEGWLAAPALVMEATS
jgi:hypothetical protein